MPSLSTTAAPAPHRIGVSALRECPGATTPIALMPAATAALRRVSGLGLKMQGSGLGVYVCCLGFGIWGLEFRVQVLGCGVWSTVFRVSGFGFQASGFGLGVLGIGFRIYGFGFRVQGLGSRI